MYLFFDTETTGLPRNWKAPVSDLNNWPRLVQLAWLFFNDDGTQMDGKSHLIKPEGFVIPNEASKIHGITTAKALADGLDLCSVLDEFQDIVSKSSVLVAHNMKFDEKIMGAEFLRSKRTNVIALKPKICTMESTVNFCRIEGPYGYKWPKLSELHSILFGVGFDEAHNAAVDITATAKCFWELKKRKVLS